jgi:carbamoyltransferase
MATTVLGISAFYHDAAAALLQDGRIIAAVQEERFSREKYDPRFPERAIEYCLAAGQVSAAEVDYVAFYEQPLTKFERLVETYVGYAPAGLASFRQAIPVWLRQKLHLPREIRRGLQGRYRGPILFPSHHESHAASAFFASPFGEAAILTMDAVGEWSTTAYGLGRDNRLELHQELRFPHSLGMLYSAFTYYCGFKVNSGEYKLMGLAPYGEPRFVDVIYRHLLDLKPDGSYWMDLSYFDYCHGLTMTGPKFDALFGGPPRRPDERIEQRHMDLAASVQRVCEEVLLRSARHVWQQTGRPRNLVMAGGVALNCVANGRVLREGPFENLWIQPAAGDAGGALGAALFVWHQLLDKPRHGLGEDRQEVSLLGPAYSNSEVRAYLDAVGAVYRCFGEEEEEADLLDEVAVALAAGQAVGWSQGRAEFGPRALGARSILADARNPLIQSTLNLKVKFRESFRPFAPCVLREHVHEWFHMRPGEDSPYMLVVAPVQQQRHLALSRDDARRLREDPDLSSRVSVPRSTVPAVTHVDYSARVQTVDERHGRFFRLLKTFHKLTACPVLVNTSFNLSWEPIVLTPHDAYQTFMQSGIDLLVINDFVLRKREQPLGLRPWARVDTASRPPDESPWADPVDGEPLVVTEQWANNPRTGARYPVTEGIPRLFVPTDDLPPGTDVTETVRQFYEKTPFPNYDDLDDPRALMEKARSGRFARLLNEQIPFDAKVVEIGCGTGQLTNFLSMAHRTVLGIDVCLNSLRLAHGFKSQHGLAEATFAQMNLFRPALRDDFFDYVISLGVLHHTNDARRAFHRICRLARPGGYVIVGLYNTYSRTLHAARRAVFRWTGLTSRLLDPQLGRTGSAGKREAWFRDQYCHPRETTHTLGEVQRWMSEAGIDFVNAIPKPDVEPELTSTERLFAPRPPGTPVSRLLSQLASAGNGYREGGFFIVIGRRSVAARGPSR